MKKILLSLIALVAFAFNASAAEVIVGNADNSTKWWTAFSETVYLLDGDNLEVSFTNYSDKVNNYDNWLAVCTNDVDRNDDANGYYEYFVLRADNYAWGTGGWNTATNPEKGTLTSNYNWDTFKEDMDGAKVDMSISRKGDTITLVANMTTTSGATYTESWEQTIENLPEKVRFFLTVEGGHLVFQSDSDAEPTYTAYGTISAADMSGYVPLCTSEIANVPVEVYGNDSIVVRNWCGVVGYDLSVALDAEGHVSDVKVNGESAVSNGYANAYTGLLDYYCMQVYMAAWNGYYYISAEPGDATTKEGVIEMYGYGYTANSSASCYYYISWTGVETGISSISADKSSVEGPAYNLAGQRVSKDAKGLVIVNGKKYFNK